MTRFRLLLPLLLAGLLLTIPVFAEKIMMVRSSLEFPEAMTALQNAIIKQGYQLSRVQRVDIGLTKAKYKTDKYRVVFFGKNTELEAILAKNPDMAAYLPLKISIFAENDQTLLVTVNPHEFKQLYPQPLLQHYFKRWQHDLRTILNQVAETN